MKTLLSGADVPVGDVLAFRQCFDAAALTGV
jgi:hypothetical protein